MGAPYGLEHAADDLLSGDADTLFVRRVTDLITGRKTSGATLELTIDPKAQAAADQALGASKGAVVALDPKTGAILAMVSHPSYDPNPLSSHDLNEAAKAWQTLSNDKDKAYLNRTINGVYPPGSTFKVVTAAAALEDGVVSDENSSVPGPGAARPPADEHQPAQRGRPCLRARRQDDAHPRARDLVQHDVRLARASSSVARRSAPRPRSSASVTRSRSRCACPSAQCRPTSTRRRPPRPRSDSTTCAATPLQMAMVAAGIANRGRVMTPYLIDSVRSANLDIIQSTPDPVELSQATSEQTASTLTKMMVSVVDHGSGARAQIDGVKVAGKTGTAQHDPGKPPHAWFISFAPAVDPKVAVAVVVEDGGVTGSEIGGGRVAAPIARAVMEAVLNR